MIPGKSYTTYPTDPIELQLSNFIMFQPGLKTIRMPSEQFDELIASLDDGADKIDADGINFHGVKILRDQDFRPENYQEFERPSRE